MMKRFWNIILVACVLLFLTGCAASPYRGSIFTDVTVPSVQLHAPIDAVKGDKVGKSSCINVLGLIATGDASVGAAMQSGGLTKIKRVENEYTSLLFFYYQHTTIVYGE
jgi:hypothetical protein